MEMKRYKIYKIWTYVLTIMVMALIVWGCFQKSTPDTAGEESRYVVVLSIISTFAVVRWLRIASDDIG